MELRPYMEFRMAVGGEPHLSLDTPSAMGGSGLEQTLAAYGGTVRQASRVFLTPPKLEYRTILLALLVFAEYSYSPPPHSGLPT